MLVTHVDVNVFKKVPDIQDKHVNALVTHVAHGVLHNVHILFKSA